MQLKLVYLILKAVPVYDIRYYKDVNPANAVIVMTVIILDISIVNVMNF